MVKYSADLDATFGALADPTRRAILARLAAGEASISDLAAPHRMTVPAVMKHLSVLVDAGLITTAKTGRVRQCQLRPEPLRGAAAWIEFYRAFWEAQFDRLAAFLAETKEPTCPPRTPPTLESKSAARSKRRRSASSRPGSTRG